MSDKISSQNDKKAINSLTGKIALTLAEERKPFMQEQEQLRLRLSSSPLYKAMAAKYRKYWDISSME